MWREYNYLYAYATPNFDRMEGNPVARQIPWDDDPTLLRAWKEAKTGFPFVDAIMTQVRACVPMNIRAASKIFCF